MFQWPLLAVQRSPRRSASLEHDRQQRVDKRPSAGINMKLLFLCRGAIDVCHHKHCPQDRRTRPTVEQGKLLGPKPPLKLKEIWAVRIRLQLDHRTRELALFNLAIDSKLRGCDLVGLRVHDVVQGSHVAARAIVMQKKTQRPVQFEITELTRDAVAAPDPTVADRPEADRARSYRRPVSRPRSDRRKRC